MLPALMKAARGAAKGSGCAPDGIGVAADDVLALGAGPDPDGGVVGARGEPPVGQEAHALHRALVPLQHAGALAAGPHPHRAACAHCHAKYEQELR